MVCEGVKSNELKVKQRCPLGLRGLKPYSPPPSIRQSSLPTQITSSPAPEKIILQCNDAHLSFGGNQAIGFCGPGTLGRPAVARRTEGPTLPPTPSFITSTQPYPGLLRSQWPEVIARSPVPHPRWVRTKVIQGPHLTSLRNLR